MVTLSVLFFITLLLKQILYNLMLDRLLNFSDEREAVCYQTVTRDECTKPVRGMYKKDMCCCSVGAAWGRPCEECPLKDTSKCEIYDYQILK
jgi:hypothetical protein